MTEKNLLFMDYDSPELTKKIYEHFKNKKFSKMSDHVEKFILQLDTSTKNSYQIEEINFISEICVKACKKLIKLRKISHRLITLTSELTNKYSNSSRIIFYEKINLSESLIVEGKTTEAKQKLKSTLKSTENHSECSDLFSKIYLILAHIYLKPGGKHEKSLKYSSKALDQCFKRVNSTHESSFFKYVIEALYLKGLYYVKVMDFKQAEKMLEKAKEIASDKTICRHLSEALKKLAREVNSVPTRRVSFDKKNSKSLFYSESLEISPERFRSNRTSFTVIPSRSLAERERNRLENEKSAAVKIQSWVKMFMQRKRFLNQQERKILSSVRRKIENVDFIISACVNKDCDVIIQATPLQSQVTCPKSYFISKSQRETFGIEDSQYISNLLSWVSVISDRVFVSHKLNKKRLIFKTFHFLMSEFKFLVKVFETEETLIVQALLEETFELVLKKDVLPSQFVISPMILLMKVKFESNKLVYSQ
jgi:tetratricopeptide (TPR) repeat protein